VVLLPALASEQLLSAKLLHFSRRPFGTSWTSEDVVQTILIYFLGNVIPSDNSFKEKYSPHHQWRRQNFSTVGAQLGHQNFDWGTFFTRKFWPISSTGAQLGPGLFQPGHRPRLAPASRRHCSSFADYRAHNNVLSLKRVTGIWFVDDVSDI
jgi:hypothetical protein